MFPCFIDMGLAGHLILGPRGGHGGFQFLLSLLLLVRILLLIDNRLHSCNIIFASRKRHVSSAECDEAGRNGR